MSRTTKWTLAGVVVVLLGYVLYVAAFELNLGMNQPQSPATLVIHTTRADGSEHQRVVARLQNEDQLYVAVNHWPRAWYRQALANPDVRVTINEVTRDYRAIPVNDIEHDMLQQRFPLGLRARFMMGFPPRHFLRLEPR